VRKIRMLGPSSVPSQRASGATLLPGVRCLMQSGPGGSQLKALSGVSSGGTEFSLRTESEHPVQVYCAIPQSRKENSDKTHLIRL
jgi:hypothetical protein